MSLYTFSLEQKLAALESEVERARRARRAPGSDAQLRYEVLKAITADVRSRLEFPRSNTLGELGRILRRMKDAPRRPDGGYDAGQVEFFVSTVVKRWPVISQALEQFGEESAE